MIVKKIVEKKAEIQNKVLSSMNDTAIAVKMNNPLPELKPKQPTKKNNIFSKGDPFEKLISDIELDSIQRDLSTNHGDLVNDSFESTDAKQKLEDVIRNEYRFDENKAKYVVSEMVGLSFIERLLNDESVSDIGYNGTFLSVESNSKIQFFTKEQLGLTDSEKQIFNIISKVANTMGKTFNRQFPILDSVSGNIRMNAIHQSSSVEGSTFSIRVLKAKMALTEENFLDFAPLFLLDFFDVLMKVGNSILVGGETGSGKTELMKLLCGKINPSDIMFVVEDVPEMKLKTLFPMHNIYSVVSTGTASLNDLLQASLRNFPKWILPSETRGKDAMEVIDSALNGHNILSSVHVANCRSMPARLVRMASREHAVNEESLIEEVLEYFGIGIQIETAKIEIDPENMIFHKIRYISEIVEFSTEEVTTLFKQELIDGDFYVTTGELSNNFKQKMNSNFLNFEFPEMESEKVEKSKSLMEYLKIAKLKIAKQVA